ncbi:16S rRNA (cytidine(1402)-2'-O)-methyltransferase [Candidatus Marinimicrobia bacterium MT.SAG.2]|nr:16S rRNA (cytidine(1402)-2'-O)-methyltransferase [Candidatus Marinimicrobia bacterium MT.SAG.2]
MLYIVATPIGNLEDISFRAVETLKTVDVVACEDTRRTGKLLNHYEIHTKMTPYHDHNKEHKTPSLIEMLKNGKSIALVSDAGTPSISDPGFYLIREAIKNELQISPIPGPSALISAAIVSGLSINRFSFEGYLPRKKGRTKRLKQLAEYDVTIVIFEGPHRILKTLRDLRSFLGDRKAAIGREMTKINEEFLRGNLSDLIAIFAERKPKGEFVILVERNEK